MQAAPSYVFKYSLFRGLVSWWRVRATTTAVTAAVTASHGEMDGEAEKFPATGHDGRADETTDLISHRAAGRGRRARHRGEGEVR